MQNKSLQETISVFADKIRFHMPAHNGQIDGGLIKCDTTELFYSDNLLNPEGILADLELYLADVFKCGRCLISTCGATSSVFQAVFMRKDSGAFLIVGDAHVSVYNALKCFNQTAYKTDTLSDIDNLPKDVKTVIFTTPSYMGSVLDLKDICNALRVKGIVTIIDASHGAHFTFSGLLPVSATEYADIVIQSLHKTLPVLTGGSLLCVKNEFFDFACLARKTLHSTSPSYPIIASIENAARKFNRDGQKIYYDIYNSVQYFKFILKPPFTVDETADFSRLVIRSPYTGGDIYAALCEKGIIAECSIDNAVCFIVTEFNRCHLELLAKILNDFLKINMEFTAFEPQCGLKKERGLFKLDFSGETEFIEIKNAVGRYAKTEIGLYPPGTPLIYSGDIINNEDVEYLLENSKNCFGITNGKILVNKI